MLYVIDEELFSKINNDNSFILCVYYIIFMVNWSF